MSGKALYISAVHVDNERGGEECDECADDTGGVAVHEVHESERAEAYSEEAMQLPRET